MRRGGIAGLAICLTVLLSLYVHSVYGLAVRKGCETHQGATAMFVGNTKCPEEIRTDIQSTDKHTDEQMTTLIDSLGSQISCSSSRETIMYQSSIFPSHLPTALSLLSSTILHPNLLPSEIEQQKLAVAYEIREIWAKPELILPEVLHTVAFRNNTLGMPLLCPEEQLAVLGEKEVRGFMRDWYRPERMVLAGVGMGHEELAELAERYFGS